MALKAERERALTTLEGDARDSSLPETKDVPGDDENHSPCGGVTTIYKNEKGVEYKIHSINACSKCGEDNRKEMMRTDSYHRIKDEYTAVRYEETNCGCEVSERMKRVIKEQNETYKTNIRKNDTGD